ncbi:hypothetical protein ACI8AK_05030 [Geodermatophilus sp. SYSU D00867]
MRIVARTGLITGAVVAMTMAGLGAASAAPPTDPGHCGELVAAANQVAPGFGGSVVVSGLAHDQAEFAAVSSLATNQCEGVTPPG